MHGQIQMHCQFCMGKIKYFVNFVANAWATFEAWSKYGLNAWSNSNANAMSNANASSALLMQIHCQMRMHRQNLMRMHCQHYQLSSVNSIIRVSAKVLRCAVHHRRSVKPRLGPLNMGGSVFMCRWSAR